MKTNTLLLLFLLISPVFAQNEPPASGDAKQELLPNQQAFLNLPEETRTEFGKHISEAHRLFQQKRVFETLEELEKATAIFAESPEIHNLRGSCYVEMRSFDKALESYQKAAELAKDNPSIQFNIGEVYFVTKKWQKAHDQFEKVLAALPKESEMSLGRLVEFKLLLCKIKLNKKDEVAELVVKFDHQDDSPFHYYANAVLAYEKDDLVKAEEWLAMAGRVFQDPNIISAWQDTLVEFGYIKSFYGDETPAE